MWFKDAFHIFNPSKHNRAPVHRFLKKHPMLRGMWVERTSHPTHVETIVQWTVQEGRRFIAVWGGDGTINRVVNELLRQDALKKTTVALVPVGTCNDFCRQLKIPSWKQWVRLGLQNISVDHMVDIGVLEANGQRRAFLNNAGFGRSARRTKARSNPIGDILAFTSKSCDMEWTAGGTTHYETKTLLLGVVCNGPFFNGGMHFADDVSVEDGVLNGFFEPPQPFVSLFGKFFKARLGGSLSGGRTVRIDGQAIHIDSKQALFPQVDGEPFSVNPVRAVDFSLAKEKLRLALWR